MNFKKYLELDQNFRKALNFYSEKIHSCNYDLSVKYLDAMKEKSSQDKNFCKLAGSYLNGNGKTLLLKEILYLIPLYCEDTVLNQHNALANIDSVSYHYNRENKSFWIFDYDDFNRSKKYFYLNSI